MIMVKRNILQSIVGGYTFEVSERSVYSTLLGLTETPVSFSNGVNKK